MPRFVITGAPYPQHFRPGQPPPARLNIVDLIKDERQFSLYIQALGEIYAEDQEELLSYFQLSGIHGLPYQPWNHSGEKSAGSYGGYCVHRTTLFPTWHRPYVVAFEQVLQARAAKIAEEYTTEKEEWKRAAAVLRQPFWDWSRAGQAVPPDEIIRCTQISIRARPDGKPTLVYNPFLKYKFHPIPSEFASPFDKWCHTVRYPKGDTDESDPDALVRTLLSNQANFTTQTWFMFALVHSWPEFSNSRADKSCNTPATSLEGIHNAVHNMTGGGGHMSSVPYAGFDPIFFLHHCGIDRLLSLWSALNPGVWVTPDTLAYGTFTVPDNAVVDTFTPLTPFSYTQETYWTSEICADTTRFVYTYPDFQNLDMGDNEAVRQRASEIIGEHYVPPYLSALRTARKTATEGKALAESSTLNNIATWDWSVRVRAKPFELGGGSFDVLIFVGPVPESPAEWDGAESYVGSYNAFVNEEMGRCENCRRQADVVTEGYVHLNGALMRHVDVLCEFEPSVVKPCLKDHLDWRIRRVSELHDKRKLNFSFEFDPYPQPDGTVVPLENVSSLEVTVVSLKLVSCAREIFPVPDGNPVLHHDVTSGRRAGSVQTPGTFLSRLFSFCFGA